MTAAAPVPRRSLRLQAGIDWVIGVDEAGRGPLAGPVCAAAYALPATGLRIAGVVDSKLIAEPERERLYEELTAVRGALWSATVTSAQRIDEINILQATMESMQISAHDVMRQCPPAAKAAVLIDGNRVPDNMELPAECIIKGDGKEYSIAAASIIAKVTRDRLMRQYHEQYPAYGFERHKGYGTAAHMAAIAQHGACPIHRMTFKPLRVD
ncbi:ribonuclease H-like domain-containing protein [Tribonema minus]|uniref:Ribonuclease n=1 Tax=Tribonema minus TaxID=303371 RepID=A0A836CIH6_9STRA|nr:ribonuclease H-like domain-containing protein [Tribonema minus]